MAESLGPTETHPWNDLAFTATYDVRWKGVRVFTAEMAAVAEKDMVVFKAKGKEKAQKRFKPASELRGMQVLVVDDNAT